MDCQVIRMRGGKPGGGKGPLIGDNMSHTLATNNDQTLICYENHAQDSRVKEIEVASLHAKAGTGGGNLPLVQSFAIAENIIGRQEHKGGNGPGFQKEIGYTLNTTGVHGVATFPIDLRNGQRSADKKDSVNRQGIGVGKDGDPANTLSTVTCHGVAYQSTVRRLTTVECARLQAFPDHHTEIPWKGKPKEACPDGPQYKAYGNSMCVKVIRWIGKQIEKELGV